MMMVQISHGGRASALVSILRLFAQITVMMLNLKLLRNYARKIQTAAVIVWISMWSRVADPDPNGTVSGDCALRDCSLSMVD